MTGDAGAGADGPPGEPRVLWSDDFEGTTGTIQDHDPSWVPIFGQLDIAASDGAVRGSPGGGDGGDDYGYRPQAATQATITADIRWDPADALTVTLVCPPGAANEALYDLGLYRDRLQLFRYDGGGDPGVYETLVQSPTLGLAAGDYRLVLDAQRAGGAWTISGELRDAADPSVVLAAIGPVEDATHGASIGQGIGIYNLSGEASRVYAMQVFGR